MSSFSVNRIFTTFNSMPMERDIDFNFRNKLSPERGRVLVSGPFLSDDYFERAVVFLCDHNEQGSFGFVLNNYVSLTLDDIMPGLPDFPGRISIGGPVQTNSLYFVHTLGDQLEGSKEVFDGIYVGGDFDEIQDMLEQGEIEQNDIRFFVGYSGWDAGQLEDELKTQSWVVSQTSRSEVMNANDDKLWERIMRRQGKKFQMMSNFPRDFTQN